MAREIALYTLEGVRDAEVSTHYLSTEDKLGLSMLRFTRGEPAGDAVLIIHGLTTSTDMFVMPEHYNLVSYLLDHGYSDVWCLDFRMSNRFSYNLAPHRYTMDDIALFDFPPAVARVREHIGEQRGLHVICHCLGSVAFTMSLFAGAVSGITSVIANSVALTPRVRAWSRLKLASAPFFVETVLGFPYLNPRWSEDPFPSRGKLFSKVVSLFHRECDVPACHMLSLMWGTGWPALYRHVMKMVRAGNRAVKYDPGNPAHAALPDDYLSRAHTVETPILFMTGEQNHIFTTSNVLCHRRLRELGCTQHELHVFPGYGHQDVFMGKDVARDIFPTLVDFLDRHRAPAQAREPALSA